MSSTSVASRSKSAGVWFGKSHILTWIQFTQGLCHIYAYIIYCHIYIIYIILELQPSLVELIKGILKKLNLIKFSLSLNSGEIVNSHKSFLGDYNG